MPSRFKKPTTRRSNPNALNKISKRLKKSAHVEVGIIKPEQKEDSEGLTVAEVAFYNEFGTENGRIPERSFLRPVLEENKEKIRKFVDKLKLKIIGNKITERKALGLLGEFVKSLVQKKITDLKNPPNAPSTIAKKGSSNPLVAQ